MKQIIVLSQKLILVTVIVLVLYACKTNQNDKASLDEIPILCGTQEEKNTSLWRLLNHVYFWNDRLDASTNPADFDSLSALMEDVKAKNPVDRYSGVSPPDEQDFSDIVEGTVNNNGLAALISKDRTKLLAASVWPGSPASTLGIKRGDEITELAGSKVATILNSGSDPQSEINLIFNQNAAVDIVWHDKTGALNQGMLKKQEFVIETVFHHEVINTTQSKIGYMVFILFIPNSAEDLNAVFQTFLDAQIEHLIVDLRYNGGGCCMETQLESQIAGENVLGKLAETKRFNANLEHRNFARDFALNNSISALNLDSVTFLTSARTASAAEGVIINLAPYIDVNLVGETTYGKAAGQSITDICGETVFISEFIVENADRFSIPADGLEPSCLVEDTYAVDWGDTADPLLAEALFLYKNGRCSI